MIARMEPPETPISAATTGSSTVPA